MSPSEAEWIAVDWGTSNLRAWGIGTCGDVMFSRTSDQGMSKLTPDAYPRVLVDLLSGDLTPNGPRIDVLVCGMAGAKQGWMEAPYLDAPADLGRWPLGAVLPAVSGARLSPRILPGICQRAAGQEDVMRGEETQLLGLGTLWPGFSGVVCMPGTHSKWVQLSGRRVEGFTTAMTGELFEILRTHSVLRHSFAWSNSRSPPRRRVPGRTCLRHRSTSKAARHALQGSRGLASLWPDTRLVRWVSFWLTDRLRDWRTTRLDRRNRDCHRRRCRTGRSLCQGLFHRWRPSPNR